jgi:DNA-directed RNA polymerase specialized sigma24 family protein
MVGMQNRGSTRDVFITLCGDDYVQSCLPESRDTSLAAIIRCIVLRNILNGRVTRQWNNQTTNCATSWLRSYVQMVYSHYQHEHLHWLHLQDKSGQMELYDLLVQYAAKVARNFGKQMEGVDPLELAHEAFITGAERLRRYPFDVTLDTWLDRHVRQCAERLVHDGMDTALYDDEVDQLMDSSRHADSTTWDEWIDLSHGIDRLSPSNRAVLFMWYLGFTLHETSNWLHLSDKAISNRRGRIQKQLGASG